MNGKIYKILLLILVIIPGFALTTYAEVVNDKIVDSELISGDQQVEYFEKNYHEIDGYLVPKEITSLNDLNKELLDLSKARSNERAVINGSAYRVEYDPNIYYIVEGSMIHLGFMSMHGTGQAVYCIEPSQPGNGKGTQNASSIWNSLNPQLKKKIARIINYGDFLRMSQGDGDYYYATQLCVYNALGFNNTNSGNMPINQWNKINGLKASIMDGANKWIVAPSFASEYGNPTYEMSYNHAEKKYEVHIYDTNNVLYSKFPAMQGLSRDGITLTFKDHGVVNGLYIDKINQEPTNINPSGFNFKAATTGTSAYNGPMVWNGPLGYREEVIFGDPSAQDVVSGLADPVYFSFTVQPKYGHVELKKVDQDGNAVHNAEFTICHDTNGDGFWQPDEPVYWSGYTDPNGAIWTPDLPDGKYTIRETKAPEGYEQTNLYGNAFEITGVNQTVRLEQSNGTIINKKIRGKFNLTKTDQYEQLLEDVEFSLYNDVNNNKKYDDEDILIEKYYTDYKGIIFSDWLVGGNYILKETNENPSYETPNFEEAFSITKADEIININNGEAIINNRIEGRIELTKVDDYNNPLEGVEFTIYPYLVDVETNELILDEDGNPQINTRKITGKIITDEKGYGYLDKLSVGKYKLVETKGIKGYVNEKYETDFEITEENRKIMIDSIINTKIEGKVEIKKINQDNIPLEGVEFSIYKDINNNNQIDLFESVYEKIITNKEGICYTSLLPEGNWLIKETKALEGYIIDEQIKKVNINESNFNKDKKQLITSFTFINHKIINETGINNLPLIFIIILILLYFYIKNKINPI